MSRDSAPWAHVLTAGTHHRGWQKLEKVVKARVGVKLEFQNAHETTGLTSFAEPFRSYQAEATIHQDRGTQRRGDGLREWGVSEDTGCLRSAKDAVGE